MTLLQYHTMQNSNVNNMEDKFAMNFSNFDAEGLFNAAHMGSLNLGMKRSAHDAGLDRENGGLSSDDEVIKKEDKNHPSSSNRETLHRQQTNLDDEHHSPQKPILPNGKKTKGRVKIKMEFIDNKLRRYTTFSKRKTGIMKKAYELSTLTGTQVMLLVASETGHVYTFATRKLQPMITSEAGKALIQTCLNSPDPPGVGSSGVQQHDQRMSATGYEETELTYAVTEEEHKSPSCASEEYLNGSSYSGSDTSSPPTPSLSPAHTPNFPLSTAALTPNSSTTSSSTLGGVSSSGISPAAMAPVHLGPGLVFAPSVTGGSVMVGNPGGGLMFSQSGSVVYAPNPSSLPEGSTPLLLNLPPGLQLSSEQGASGSSPQLVTLPMNLASAAALQQSAAAAAVVSAAAAAASAISTPTASNSANETLPTDLSLHIKRENNS